MIQSKEAKIEKQNFFNMIVPTIGNVETIRETLKSIADQTYKNFKIIICDNSQENLVKNIAQEFVDTCKLEIIRHNERISMSENWESAIKLCDDGWVSFIGGDDGLLPDALKYVNQVMTVHQYDAFRFRPIEFIYPNRSNPGKIYVKCANGMQIRDGKVWINKVLEHKANYGDLPVIYNGGFVKLSIIKNATVSDNKEFFSSINPDIVSGFKIAHLVKEYYFDDSVPFFINGASSESNGMAFMSNNKKKIELFWDNNKHKPHFLIYNGQNKLPRSIPLCNYEAYLNAYPSENHVNTDYVKHQFVIALHSYKSHTTEIIEYFSKLKDYNARYMNVSLDTNYLYKLLLRYFSISRLFVNQMRVTKVIIINNEAPYLSNAIKQIRKIEQSNCKKINIIINGLIIILMRIIKMLQNRRVIVQ